METVRAFISIKIPEMPNIREVLERLRAVPGTSVPADVHMTLRFLGDVETNKIKRLSERMGSLEEYPSFDVSTSGSGAFPNTRDPRIVWIGAGLGTPFYDILSDIDRMLGSLSIGFDRKPFRPHVTVSRVKRRSEHLTDILNEYRCQDIGSFRCGEILLMSSVLTPSGAEHAVIGTFPLSDG